MSSPRPARLSNFSKPIDNFVFPAVHGVEHVKCAAFRENEMARIRAPNGIFPRTENAPAARRQIEDCYLKVAAASNVERNLFSIRRPARLGAVAVAGRK